MRIAGYGEYVKRSACKGGNYFLVEDAKVMKAYKNYREDIVISRNFRERNPKKK